MGDIFDVPNRLAVVFGNALFIFNESIHPPPLVFLDRFFFLRLSFLTSPPICVDNGLINGLGANLASTTLTGACGSVLTV